MGILAWVLLGLICGAIAKMIMGGGPGGWIADIIIGIIGAIVGGFIASLIFGVSLGGFFDLRTWIIGILGSCLCLWIYHRFAARGTAA